MMGKQLTKLKIAKLERRAQIILSAGISLLLTTLIIGTLILAGHITVFSDPIGTVLACIFLGAEVGAFVLIAYLIGLLDTEKIITEDKDDTEPREPRL